jgi:Helix-turn-helix domain
LSVEAITWALKQPIEKSSTKFVLVALANCANTESSEAYPSVKYLSDATAQDRKTVLTNLKRLIDSGHITDSGKRVGSTGQIIVYRINSTFNGIVKECQKRNSTENGTVPKFPHNSTEIPSKEYRFSHETVPKTGHGTVNEPSLTVNEPIKSKDELSTACPHSEILKLWKSKLPHLAQPRSWEGSRKTNLKNRWIQASKVSDYSPEGYKTLEAGLKWWSSFFDYIANDTRLSEGFESKERTWRPDLEWVVNATNFQKIIDGKYNK